MKRIIVTGGAGFIGSALIKHLVELEKYNILNIDKLTYASNLNSLNSVADSAQYNFLNIDICNKELLEAEIRSFKPHAIMHLAAESHVDRSINDPTEFISSNIIGTFNLLESVRFYWNELDSKEKKLFKFHHISTDEVYGDLDGLDDLFLETTPYMPSSPYSASKASSDHLVRAWNRTYGLPTIVTNCSNNYGPFQFPEKLIPKTIISALNGKKITIYGNGTQIRDWLFVDDHARALEIVISKGVIGETYNIGGHNEITNIDVVNKICSIMDETITNKPKFINNSFKELIVHTCDRPGHDKRYAIDAGKIKSELGWEPNETFNSGIKKTVDWYLRNNEWWKPLI